MKTLHEKNSDNENFDSKENHSEFSRDSHSLRHYSLGTKEIQAYTELGLILRRIHKRITAEQRELKNNNGNSNQENQIESLSG